MMLTKLLAGLSTNSVDITKSSAPCYPNSSLENLCKNDYLSSSNIIVTYKLKDFPNQQLAQYNIETPHPNLFLMHLADLNQTSFLIAVKHTQ